MNKRQYIDMVCFICIVSSLTLVRSDDTGGGVPKHHICNANLMKNGADFAVYLNTAQEFDGSDSGARPDEAVSWGKIRMDARPVKVYGDASILFPLLVSQTFLKEKQRRDGGRLKEEKERGERGNGMS